MERTRKEDKKVSVIIPIYNGEKYIEETVRSVLAQNYRNLEVLCIIDGTKDASKEILLAIGDPRLVVLEKENRGATFRRNEGAEHIAKGQYLWFLDQDDVIAPDCIGAAVQELERTGSAAVAVNGNLIDSNSNVIRRMYRVNKPVLTLNKLMKGNQLFTTSQVLVKKKVFVKLGGFSLDAGIADDWDMWIRLLRAGEKMVFLDRQLMGYRLHDNNNSRNLEKMLKSEMHIVEKTLDKVGDPKKIKSYSYMRYSSRAADWKSLSTAVSLNSSLLLSPRFYLTACHIMIARMKKNGGAA